MQSPNTIPYNMIMYEKKGQPEGYPTDEVFEPLTEQYDETKHSKIYNLLSGVLYDALKSDKSHAKLSVFSKVRNIALSGGYGTGKSSVLCQLKNDCRFQDPNGNSNCLFISLSSLNGQDNKPSENKQGDSDQTDLIEKEIVKQLLYQESSTISHFRRLRNINDTKRRMYSTILGLLLFLFFTGLGWMEKIYSFFLPKQLGSFVYIHQFLLPNCIFKIGISALLLAFFIWIFHTIIPTTVQGHIHLKSMTAGSASLSLAGDDDETYFDKYLDEIAYFFSTSKKQVVVFEDIDRFNNTRIFEDLKELNTILNQDPSNGGKAICFVYAVRDSIFDAFGDFNTAVNDDTSKIPSMKGNNIERANRTKFFDLIIPMVPFMSPTAAKGLISSEFQNEGIDRRLISLLSKYITDMRLIKNIHNEFLVFRSELMPEEQESNRQVSLDVNHILAMVAYKNIYPKDFEKLRLGTSYLDDIYRFKLQIVEQTRRAALHKSEVLQNQVADKNGSTKNSKKLGRLLRNVLQVVNSNYNSVNILPLKLDQYTYQKETQLESVEFWSNAASLYEKDKNLVIVLANNVDIKFSALNELFTGIFDDENWMNRLDAAEQQEIDRLHHLLERTAHANLQTVMNQSDWLASPSTGELKSPCNLNTFVQECYGHTLGRDLIKWGYIADDYQLYAASHNNMWLSNDGVNFAIHNLTNGEHSLDWQLTYSDCQAIYTDFGSEITKSKDAYNVQFLDWLLAQHPEQAGNMLRSPANYDDWDREFYAAYLNESDISSKNRKQIVGVMAAKSDKIFNFLVDSDEFDENQRQQYTSVALTHIKEESSDGKNMGADVRDYLQNRDCDLKCMRDAGLAEDQANMIANYYKCAKISLNNISSLSPVMLNAIKKQHNYKVNKNNFLTIFGPQCDLSLNEIREKDSTEYALLLNYHLSDYMEKVNPKATITGEKSKYVQIVHEVIDAFDEKGDDDDSTLATVIKKSKPNERITDLSDIFPGGEVSDASWALQSAILAMAEQELFVPKPSNIIIFLHVMNPDSQDPKDLEKSFDELMKCMPLSEEDLRNEDLEDGELVQLATLILNSDALGSDLHKKIQLVQSLNLSPEALDANQLTDRESALFAELIKIGLLPSTADVFNLLKSETARIACIRGWKTIVEGAKIPDSDLHFILIDTDVSQEVKNAIYKKLPDYLNTADSNIIKSIVKDAAASHQELSLKVLKWVEDHIFNKDGKNDSSSEEDSCEYLKPFISLLAIALSPPENSDGLEKPATENEELCSILMALPGEYPKLIVKTKGGGSVKLPLNEDNVTIAKAVKGRLETISKVKKWKKRAKLQCIMSSSE